MPLSFDGWQHRRLSARPINSPERNESEVRAKRGPAETRRRKAKAKSRREKKSRQSRAATGGGSFLSKLFKILTARRVSNEDKPVAFKNAQSGRCRSSEEARRARNGEHKCSLHLPSTPIASTMPYLPTHGSGAVLTGRPLATVLSRIRFDRTPLAGGLLDEFEIQKRVRDVGPAKLGMSRLVWTR